MSSVPVLTIDGPSGSGKGTLARRVAEKLGWNLLDSGACRCKDYANRKQHVPDCVKLTPETVGELSWLPKTCETCSLALVLPALSSGV